MCTYDLYCKYIPLINIRIPSEGERIYHLFWWLIAEGYFVVYFQFRDFFCLSAWKASAYANLNFGIPYTFLALLDTFESFLQFCDNPKIFLEF